MLFSFIKKFIFGLFYYKHKFNNNKEIGRILLKYCVSEWRRENKVKFKSTVSEINFGLIRVYDQKFIKLIKQIFNDNSNVYFNDTMFNLINSLGDIHDELCKCERVLKIKRNSALYRYVLRNNKIISPEIDPEDVFFYFIQNIKSDLYLMRHKEKEIVQDKPLVYSTLKSEEKTPQKNKSKYISITNESYNEKNDV